MLRTAIVLASLLALSIAAVPNAAAACTNVGYNPVTGQRLVSDCTTTGTVQDGGYTCAYSHRTVEVNDIPVFQYNAYTGGGPCWSHVCIDYLVYVDTNPARAGVGCQ